MAMFYSPAQQNMPQSSYGEAVLAKGLEAGISDASTTDHSTSSSETSSDDELISSQASCPISVPVSHEDAGHQNLAGFLESNGTTLVLLNVPRKYTLPVLLNEIVAVGFHPHRDLCFLHMPMIPKANVNFGYCVVSFTDISIMDTFISVFDGRRMWLSKHEVVFVRRYMPPPGLELSSHTVNADAKNPSSRAPTGVQLDSEDHLLESVKVSPLGLCMYEPVEASPDNVPSVMSPRKYNAVPSLYKETTFHGDDRRRDACLQDLFMNTRQEEAFKAIDDAGSGMLTDNMASTVPGGGPICVIRADASRCALLSPFHANVPSPANVQSFKDMRSQTQIAQQFHKTKMCVFFSSGKCAYGVHCAYAHSHTELQRNLDLNKTRLCSNFLRQRCFDPACRFAHGHDELRSLDGIYKTVMCRLGMIGHCKNASACRFAHTSEELGPMMLQ